MERPMNNSPIVAMMMAMDANKLIGADNSMPWHIPGEQAYFKTVTMGKPVIMGRKTFESIGKPLVGRSNIVVTSNHAWQHDGTHTVSSIEEALSTAKTIAARPESVADEVMVIGGAALCRDFMPITERLYLTYIDAVFEGDTWLESFHWNEWQEISRETRDPAEIDGLDVTYFVLERRAELTS